MVINQTRIYPRVYCKMRKAGPVQRKELSRSRRDGKRLDCLCSHIEGFQCDIDLDLSSSNQFPSPVCLDYMSMD